MRRVVLVLTEAQAAWLRGAVRSHAEDMAVSGMLSKADEKHKEAIIEQLAGPLKVVKQPKYTGTIADQFERGGVYYGTKPEEPK
jgi:hypothetical protein